MNINLKRDWYKIVLVILIVGGGLWQVSAWAQDMRNGITRGDQKDEQHDTRIASIENKQDKMHDMLRTMFVIDSVKNADDTELMAKVYEITNNDTIDSTTMHWAWEDSLYRPTDTIR